MTIAVAPIDRADASKVAAWLIPTLLGVEIVAVDEASARGDSQAGQAVSLEALRYLGQTATTRTQGDATKRASDALSDAEKRVYSRRARVINHCHTLFEHHQKGMKRREIFRLAAQAVFIEEQNQARAGELEDALSQPLSWRTVESLWRNYVDNGEDIRALKPRFCDRGQKLKREKNPVIALAQKTLHEQWLPGKLGGLDAVRMQVAKTIREASSGELLGKKAPSERTLYREIDRDPVLRAHLRAINNKPLQKLVGLRERVERPLDEVQIDEAFLDWEVIGATANREAKTDRAKTGSVLFCVDSCTGMPLGLNLGVGPANVERARLLMLHAIEPKPPIVLADGTTVQWAGCGLPRVVRGDKAAIFTSNDFVLPLADLGIRAQETPIDRPWLKGVVERFNGVVKRWLRMKRRSAQSGGRRPGDDKEAGKALITYEDLQRLLELTIAKHLLRARRRRGEATIDRFARLTKIYPPRMPEVKHELLVLGIRTTAKLTREGISHRDIHFRAQRPDDVLRNPKNWGRDYDICIHPRHLDYNILLHPSGHWIRLDRADQPDADGLSVRAFDAHRRHLAEQARSNPQRESQRLAIDQEISQLKRQSIRPPPAAPPPPALPPPIPSEAANDDDYDPLEEDIPCLTTKTF